MINHPCTFLSFVLISAATTCSLYAEGATDAATRMKAWEQHVKLREESIFKDVKWTAVGPRIQGGKIESIWAPKKRKSTIYVGVGSGNLWKTVNNGTTWKPIFEDQSTFSVAVVTVCDKDPKLVWVGTGEPHMARSSYAGTGVFKSTDAGETWQHMGLVDTHHIGRVLIDPKNSDVVYVAALGHQYTHNEQRGVFKTTDGGKTWEKILYISEKIGVVELAMDPSDNRTLYAIAWERDRKAWNNVVAGPGSGLYKSTDAGKTWKRITKGLPTGEKVGRMGIAIAPSNPNILYIICDQWTCISPDLTTNPGPEKRGNVPFGTITDVSESAVKRGLLYVGTDDRQLHVSRNDGASWTKINRGLPDRWVSRVVASKYEEGTAFVTFTGYREDDFEVYVYMTKDFGKTWKSIAANLPSEPVNVIREDPGDKDILYLGTDLGAYCSIDRGQTWHSLSKTLPTTPVYDMDVHAEEEDLVAGTHGRSAFVLDTKKIKEIKNHQ